MSEIPSPVIIVIDFPDVIEFLVQDVQNQTVIGITSHFWRQAIIWTKDGILLIRTLGTNFSEILSKIHSFSRQKMHLKMSSAKWRLSRLGLIELTLNDGIMTCKLIPHYWVGNSTRYS